MQHCVYSLAWFLHLSDIFLTSANSAILGKQNTFSEASAVPRSARGCLLKFKQVTKPTTKESASLVIKSQLNPLVQLTFPQGCLPWLRVPGCWGCAQVASSQVLPKCRKKWQHGSLTRWWREVRPGICTWAGCFGENGEILIQKGWRNSAFICCHSKLSVSCLDSN